MVENDIYDNKKHYDYFVNNLNPLLVKPKSKKSSIAGTKTTLHNYKKLFKYFNARDLSYVRRLRFLRVMKMIV